MLKDLLAIVDSAERAAPFLQNAVSLAERHGAHLTVVVLTSYPLVAVELAPFGSLFIPEDALASASAIQMAAFERADFIGQCHCGFPKPCISCHIV